MPGAEALGQEVLTHHRGRRGFLVRAVTLLEIKTAQLEALLPKCNAQVLLPIPHGLHGRGVRDPEANVHLAALHLQMDGHLTEGIRMELELRLLGTALEHPLQSTFHLQGRRGGRWRGRWCRLSYRNGSFGHPMLSRQRCQRGSILRMS